VDEVHAQANSALETLFLLNRHMADCRQCCLDPVYCREKANYDISFRRDYAEWERLRKLASVR
jgi:hypothetical protein